MAALSFDLRHFEFDHGVQLLKQGFEAARDALLNEIERIKADARAYEEELANGGAWIGEMEDGHKLWDQSDLYEAKTDDAHRALYEVRRAFVIALYHHWERSAIGWLGRNDATHEELERYCADSGFGPAPNLGAVRYLANHLKHKPGSNSRWFNKLRKEYPSFLPHVQTSPLALSDTDFETVATVILASGPPEPGR